MVSEPTSPGRSKEDDDDAYLTLTGRSSGAGVYTLWIKDHSRNTESYPKSQAFESLEAFKMYYARLRYRRVRVIPT